MMIHALSKELNLSEDEITSKNVFWFKHKCDFVGHLRREQNQQLKTQQMRLGR